MGWFGDALGFGAKAVKWGAPAALAPLTGGASLGLYGVYGQSSANKENIRLAREQMEFQERMSSTEVQRRMADLKAAGLNPMLASPGAASAPSGALARVENPAGEFVRDASSAAGAALQRGQLEQMDAQTRLINQNARLVAANATDVEARLPFSAFSAEMSAREISSRVTKLNNEVANLMQQHNLTVEDVRQRRLSNEQLEKLQPLLLEAQRIANASAGMGLAGSRNVEEFEKAMGSASPLTRWIFEAARAAGRR